MKFSVVRARISSRIWGPLFLFVAGIGFPLLWRVGNGEKADSGLYPHAGARQASSERKGRKLLTNTREMC